MTIKTQKILMFLPIIHISIIFMCTLTMWRKSVSVRYITKLVLKMFVNSMCLLVLYAGLIALISLTNITALETLSSLIFAYCFFLSASYLSIKAQEDID